MGLLFLMVVSVLGASASSQAQVVSGCLGACLGPYVWDPKTCSCKFKSPFPRAYEDSEQSEDESLVY